MKTKAVFVTIFILIILVMTWQANIAKSQVITDGLVSYWTLNKADIDGETAMDVFGENDGTLIGSPKIVQGKFGEGVEFDGSDDYCELPQILLGDFTIEAWFSALSTPGT